MKTRNPRQEVPVFMVRKLLSEKDYKEFSDFIHSLDGIENNVYTRLWTVDEEGLEDALEAFKMELGNIYLVW